LVYSATMVELVLTGSRRNVQTLHRREIVWCLVAQEFP